MPPFLIPPVVAAHEPFVSAAAPQFAECRSAFSGIVGARIVVRGQSFTRAEPWGYLMRVRFQPRKRDGAVLPPSTFLCWTLTGKPIRFAVAPGP